MRVPPLVLLDLDETLVHVSRQWVGRAPDSSFRLRGECYHVYMRPGVHAFLNSCFLRFRVGVWTAAQADYAACVLRRLLGSDWRRRLTYFLHRGHCDVSVFGGYVKPLRRFDVEERAVWLVDDNLEHYYHNMRLGCASQRVVPCRPYFGAENDSELKRIGVHLRVLADVDDRYAQRP